MKKLFKMVCLFAMTQNAFSQPTLTDTELWDDFSTTTDYVADNVTGRGLYWWGEQNVHTLSRDYANKELDVTMTQQAYQYKPFGVSFGDDNGAAAGGVPNTIDLSANGKFSFVIKNTGTEAISVRVACQDVNKRLVDCSPGALVFGDIWKYQTQIEVPVGQTVLFKVGTANGAGGGIINNCDFANGVWGDYSVTPHVIRRPGDVGYCDLTKIESIIITVLNAAKNSTDGHNLALTAGAFSISDFRVGSSAVTPVFAPIHSTSSFNVYPNPSSNVINIDCSNFTLGDIENVLIMNSVGQVVFTAPINNNPLLSLDVSELNEGVYTMLIGHHTQKLMIKK
jgi:hypothetical protein